MSRIGSSTGFWDRNGLGPVIILAVILVLAVYMYFASTNDWFPFPAKATADGTTGAQANIESANPDVAVLIRPKERRNQA